MKGGKFNALEYYLNELNQRGIRFRETLNVAINNLQKKLEDIHNKFRFDDNDFQRVRPAFQWAQSMTHVHIEIKFAHRHDSPGCLEVKNQEVDLHANLVVFSAYCVLGDIPIKFELNLELFTDINREESTWGFGSVGRYALTLKKKTPQMYWDQLLKIGNESPSNMKVWWEMREKFASEIDKYMAEDEDEEFDRQTREHEKEMKAAKAERRKNSKKKKEPNQEL